MFVKSQPGAHHRRLREVRDRAGKAAAPRTSGDLKRYIPDLLHRQPYLSVDGDQLLDLLGLGFLGMDLGGAMDQALSGAQLEGSGWSPRFFSDDLFVADFATAFSTLNVGGATYPANRPFLTRALENVPTDLETIEMRQGILREINADPELLERFQSLYRDLYTLLSLFETPGYQGSIDTASIHLEILLKAKSVIDSMATDFATAESALGRLRESGSRIQETDEYALLSALLEYESGMAELTLQVRIGGDGRIRQLIVEKLRENETNPFYKNPWRRIRDRLRLLRSGYDFSSKELMKRLVNEIFDQLSPSLIPLIQLMGHLEFYLCNLAFKDAANRQGLEVSLAQVDPDNALRATGLFNPLLLLQPTETSAPIPCSIHTDQNDAITLVTGPNSGGKTRLLQALGWVQLLGQSGLYAPAGQVQLRPIQGLFVSLVETESAAQTEGRLGRELVRIRSLFEEIRPASMVILDELCSGTNPSEGVEVFAMVLQLLRRAEPTAFVTTHFLDFARTLQANPPIAAMEFLQVDLDPQQRSTYQFRTGVADTSLAALTAARLGVTFERLSAMIAPQPESPAERADCQEPNLPVQGTRP